MGLEAVCTARFQGRAAEGKALLETDALFFRGDLRLKIPLKSVTAVTADSGDLSVTFRDGTAVFEIGETADKWAHAMLHPKGRVDKLGIKAGMRIALVGLDDTDFRDELISRDALLEAGGQDLDVIFFGINCSDDLANLHALSERIKPAGSIWVVSPRGTPAVTERDVMNSARGAGLVDVKVVRFSDTHTSAKLVIPVALRKKVKA